MVLCFLKRGLPMGNTNTQAAAAFTAANLGSQGVFCSLAIKAFITANGIGNINVQLTPAAVQANALMGGANFWRAMQPANGKAVGHFGQMLWVMVNGSLPAKYWQPTAQGYIAPKPKFITSMAWLNTKVPTKVPAAVPLAMVQAIAANSGSSVTSSLNQNPVLKAMAGGSSPSSVGWGNPLAQLVVAS